MSYIHHGIHCDYVYYMTAIIYVCIHSSEGFIWGGVGIGKPTSHSHTLGKIPLNNYIFIKSNIIPFSNFDS